MSRFNYSTSSFDKDDGDISEADPNDIAKMLKETDDLDGDLFKGITKNNFSKTMPAQNKPASIMARNKSFNFDDDPLADFDSLVGKQSAKQASKPSNDWSMPTSQQKPLSSTYNPSNDWSMPTPQQKPLNSTYNPSKQESLTPNFNQTAPMPSKTKSLAEDLFGKSNVGFKSDEAPGFKLNEKYVNMSQQSNNNTANNKVDDDFSFGGYQPTASAPRQTGMKRNVSFTDDLFGSGNNNNDMFSSMRPKTTSSSGNKQEDTQNNLMRTMPNPSNKSTDEWLNGSNDTKKKSMDFSLDDLLKPRDSVNNNKANISTGSKNVTSGSELDWLGFKDSSKDSIEPPKSLPYPRSSQDNIFEKPPLYTPNGAGQKGPGSGFTKDSMNSSFADSIENNENRMHNNNHNKDNHFNEKSSDPMTGSVTMSPTVETKDADEWLSNLMNNKKPTSMPVPSGTGGPKKPSNDLDRSLDPLVLSGNSKLNNSNQFNEIISTNNLKTDKPKQNYFLQDRASTPEIPQNVAKLDRVKSVSASNVAYDGNNDTNSLYQKIKQLEYDSQDLNMQLTHNKAHYELQLQLNTESCDNRLRMIKEDRENGLRLFKEEKEILQNHIDLIEKEKHEMTANYKRKMEDTQKECDQEIEKLRDIQRESVKILKEDHEDAIKRLRQLKDTELDAAMSATAHTRTIESVLNLIEDNTKNLDGLSQKVQQGHMVNLSEHEIQIRSKQENLKVQEDRLLRRQKEYESEIRNLNETIQRLEGHLAEQTKSVAEERWKGKQQEKKLEALQDALINEQKIAMEKISRDRNDVERSKDDILMEQKRLMQQLYEDKRKLAEERAQIEAAVASYKDRQHKDSLKNINIEAEISVSTRRLTDETGRLEKLGIELKEKEFILKQEKIKIDEKNMEIEKKTAKLEQMAATVNHKFIQAEEMYNRSNKDKDAQMRLYDQENKIKSSHETRLNQIQQQLLVLNEKETQVNQEKLGIYRERQELEMFKSNILCTKCKEPVRDFGVSGLQTSGYASYIQNTQNMNNSLLNSVKYNSPLNNFMTSTGNDLEQSRILRTLKMQSIRDRQFVNEEKHFIDSLKSGSVNGFLNRSISMNQLNSTLA